MTTPITVAGGKPATGRLLVVPIAKKLLLVVTSVIPVTGRLCAIYSHNWAIPA
ncbi:hypothetical protein DPMN_174002 [Dreissena polymorpha]|uniref:Uncharacterized protein n=1 Tax=Dreissena polymorpha TaxID=45954 RepID=A0A9D4E577_DREPO|nr:hypothetical protein DPMN_174002 [Dreissena polymorpha]